MSESLRIGVAGLGTVGLGVVKLLAGHSSLIAKRCGMGVNITAISARDKNQNRGLDLSAFRWFDNPIEMAADPEVDVVLELIGGESGIALDVLETALNAKKSVVTANKALLAHHGMHLATLAEKANVSLNFEAAIAGGVPVVKALREGLAGNRIKCVYGILNGTCNYILTEMEDSGRSFSEVLTEAQELGYAEIDPSFDIDGIDTAHKLSILTSIAFGCQLDFQSVHIEGIRHVSEVDINFARELGYRIKLLAISCSKADGIEQRVTPCMVSMQSPISHVKGAFNAVVVEGDVVGRTIYEGQGAGEGPTASAVVADIIDIVRRNRPCVFGMPVADLNATLPISLELGAGTFYVRLTVVDKPGVMADIAAIFRDECVSLESVLQRGRNPDEIATVILTTHYTTELSMKRSLQKIGELKEIVEIPRMIRIEKL